MNTLQSTLVPLEVSEDNGVTWLQLVCLENYTVSISPQTTETTTYCGVAIGLGPIKFSASGSAVCESSPNNSTQATFNRLLNWCNQKETISFRCRYPGGVGGSAGVTFFIMGNCLVAKADLKLNATDIIKYDFELAGVGNVSIND